jgi:MYXO-CTERM domain-containing protein
VLAVTATAGGERHTITRRFCVWDEASSPARGSAWRQLGGGPDHRGAIDAPIAPPLVVAWTRSVGGFVRGAPVLDDGRLFVPVTGHGTAATGGVVALDAATGALLWAAGDGGPVDAPLAVDGDRVIAAGLDGVVRAFDVDTGDLDWERDLGEGVPPQARGLHAGPTIAGGTIYAGHMYRFAALAPDGDVRWMIEPSDATFPSFGEATVAATPTLVAGVFGFGDEGVIGLAAATGREDWRFADPIMAGTLAPPALDGARAIVATGRGEVVSIDLGSGDEAWRTTLVPGGFDYALWMRAAPAIAGDRIFVAGQRDGLHALARAGGAPLWTYVPSGTGPLRTVHYEATSGAFSSAPVITGDVVWIGGDDGVLRALDAATGAHRWSIDLGAPILSGVVPSARDDGGGALYVATWDGSVRALVTPDPPSAAPPVDGCGCRSGRDPSPTGFVSFAVVVVLRLARRSAR